MAEVDQTQFSLMSLEDELTCSICLSPFDCPVTIPCGHNFCQKCLLGHWKDSYDCPQCRTLFPTKPELKKNTVLSTVVKTFNLGSNKHEESKEKEKEDAILCDTCMVTEASQTCLTCMASFCEEHLRPHRENPKFSIHQLTEPIGDLSEHLCLEHNKLIEFFCTEHKRPICSLCLQQVHKGCPFVSPEEQRNQKEAELRDKLSLLDVKLEKTETVLSQMQDMQSRLKDSSTKKKTALSGLFQEMRDLLTQKELEAKQEVDWELGIGLTKHQDFTKRFKENAEKMIKAREIITDLLSQSRNQAFLQTSFNLPKVVNFDPHPPRINLDSKNVTATHLSAAALKQHLMELLQQSADTRLETLKSDKEVPASRSEGASGARNQAKPGPAEHTRPPRSHSPGRPPIEPWFQPVPVSVYINSPASWTPPQNPFQNPRTPNFHGGPPFNQKTHMRHGTGHQKPHNQAKQPPGASGSDYTKKENPKGHGPPRKPAKGNPQPKKP